MGGALQGTLGKLFNPTIAGTGQTASDLTKLGYSGSDLASMDPKQALISGLFKGGLSGIGGMARNPASGGPSPMIPSAPMATPVDPSYFQPTNFRGPTMMPARPAIYG